MSGVLLENSEQGFGNKIEYSGRGTRALAIFADTIIAYIAGIIIGAVISYPESSIYYIIILVVYYGYFIIFEGIYGQTFGKMACKIRVVKEDGSPCDIKSALIRNVIRLVDALPAAYIIGIISIIKSDKEQRLGDRLAKTIVIKDK